MTNNIYPPDHLLRKWESLIIDEEQNVDVVLYEAFQAGADQELEACCEWISKQDWTWTKAQLVAARRPNFEPEEPTAMQIIALADEIEKAGLGQVDLVRAALARWGNHPESPDSSTQETTTKEGVT